MFVLRSIRISLSSESVFRFGSRSGSVTSFPWRMSFSRRRWSARLSTPFVSPFFRSLSVSEFRFFIHYNTVSEIITNSNNGKVAYKQPPIEIIQNKSINKLKRQYNWNICLMLKRIYLLIILDVRPWHIFSITGNLNTPISKPLTSRQLSYFLCYLSSTLDILKESLNKCRRSWMNWNYEQGIWMKCIEDKASLCLVPVFSAQEHKHWESSKR